LQEIEGYRRYRREADSAVPANSGRRKLIYGIHLSASFEITQEPVSVFNYRKVINVVVSPIAMHDDRFADPELDGIALYSFLLPFIVTTFNLLRLS